MMADSETQQKQEQRATIGIELSSDRTSSLPSGLSNGQILEWSSVKSPITGVMGNLVRKAVYFLYACAQSYNEGISDMSEELQAALSRPLQTRAPATA